MARASSIGGARSNMDQGLQRRHVLGRWQAFFAEPGFAVAALVLIGLFGVFIVFPVLSVLRASLGWKGELTIQHYVAFFRDPYYYMSLTNSVLLGLIVTLLVLGFGLCYALWVRNVRPGVATVYRVLALLPLVAPPFIFSLSLIVLGGRRGLIAKLLGVGGLSLYGWPGVVLAQLIAFFPLGYMMIEHVLRSVNPVLYDASEDMGAREWHTFRHVTLPLISPGLVKAALLVFVMSMADFGNPAMIGGGLAFLATETYLLVVGQYNIEMAAVLSVFLILPSLVVFVLHNYILKDKKYTTIGGVAGAYEHRGMSWGWKLVLGAVSTLVVATILAAFAVIFIAAFTKIITVNHAFTLEHFKSQVGWSAFRNSLKTSLAAAALSAFLGVVASYLIARKPVPWKGALEFVGLFGFAVPGTVVGLGYILAFNKPPLLLTGTIWILVLNFLFRNVAVGLEAGLAKLGQMDIVLEEASGDLGARPMMTLRRVVFPMMGSAFGVGFIYAFMTSMVTVSSAVFLVAPGVNLAAVYILSLAEQAAIGRAAAMAVLLIAAVMVCLGAMRLVTRRLDVHPGAAA